MKTLGHTKSGSRGTTEAPATSDSPRIILAEDDDEMRTLLVTALRKTGCEVVECSDGIALLDHLAHFLLPKKPENVHLVISDIRNARAYRA